MRDAKTIHVLKVESVGPKGVTFEVPKALEGKLADAPFRFAEILRGEGCDGLFRVGSSVLCFRQGEMATLFVNGHWAYAVEPIDWRSEKHWFCLSTDVLDVAYEGTTAVLLDHVVAILAGKERTVTARPPNYRSTSVRGRLWRIKAGTKVTRLVSSDESPHFVGWGSGDPKEALLLADALRAAATKDRIAAAEELAHLGSEAKPALPALRRALADPDPRVGLAVARTLVLVDPKDDRGIEAIVARLKDADAKVRADAVTTLAECGLRARKALPPLLRALKDASGLVRGAAATTIGRVAPGSDAEASALVALGVLLKDGTEEGRPAVAAVHALRPFGHRAWSMAPLLRKTLPTLDDPQEGAGEALVGMLARLNPPPVEFLAEVLVDPRSGYAARRAASAHLVALGPRARLALPRLRRGLAKRVDSGAVDIAEALLAIDPDRAPPLIAPVLLALAKRSDSRSLGNEVRLLGRCGPAGRPALAALLPTLEPDGSRTSERVRQLTPLLGPQDRALLPELRRLLAQEDDPLPLAEILRRLGMRGEALEQAITGLKSKYPGRRVDAAEWIGAWGREARAAGPELRRAVTKATGSERIRISLALWRACARPEGDSREKAFVALEGLSKLGSRWEEDDFEEGLVEVHSRLIADRDAVTVLARALGDRNPHVRLVAACTLARVQPEHPDTVPALRRLLVRHPDYFRYAADTLAALGPQAKSLAPILMPLLRTEGEEGYFAAERVLRRIDPVLAANGRGSTGVADAVPEDLTSLWADLAGSDAFRADLAIWRLAGAGPRAVALVRERLRPPPSLASERVVRLIADLDSDEFETRERASAELGKFLESAGPALRKAHAEDPPPEVRTRLDRLLERADLLEAPEQRRRMRAVRLLTETDCPEARALLERLARDVRFDSALEARVPKRQINRP